MAALTGDNDQILAELAPLLTGSEIGERGLAELAEMTSALAAVGVPSERFKIDVAIARGLDYYTGTVLETFLDELPEIGSVCSGGRYDNLAELYTKEHLPGVGASLGLDRLLAAMEELGLHRKNRRRPHRSFCPSSTLPAATTISSSPPQIRASGIGVEFYPESKKLGKQLQYADRRGFRIALIAGENEFQANECQVKDLATGGSTTVSLANNAAALIAEIRQILGS